MKQSPGNALMINIRRDGKGRIQMVIVGGPIPASVNLGEFMAGIGHERLPELHVSPWCDSEAEARTLTVPVYFQIYERQEGFKHPEDPTLTAADPVGQATVVTLKDGWHG